MRLPAGGFRPSRALFDRVMRQAQYCTGTSQIFNLLVVLNNNQARLKESLVYGKQGLAVLGMQLADDPDAKKAALAQAFATITWPPGRYAD